MCACARACVRGCCVRVCVCVWSVGAFFFLGCVCVWGAGGGSMGCVLNEVSKLFVREV